MALPRIVVGDPQDLIVEGLCHLLAPRFQIVAAVRDGKSLWQAALAFRPDLIAADFESFRFKEKDFDVLHQIITHLPCTKVLCLLTQTEQGTPKRKQAGIFGYVSKTSSKEGIVAAVSEALNGVAQPPKPATRGTNGSALTSRQHAILQMIADGRSSKEMAYELKISVRTVEFHRANLRSQLGVRTTAELTKRAIQGY